MTASPSSPILIAGGGVFGLTAAIELQQRGHQVTLLDPGPLPHPDAASTDISKVIRMDYGADELYLDMMEQSLALWRAWNEEFGETIFHETGVLYITLAEMQLGDFEYDSLQLLQQRGHPVELLTPDTLKQRFPAWAAERYMDGYYNPQGGWAASGRVCELLAQRAADLGVRIEHGVAFKELRMKCGRLEGMADQHGRMWPGEQVILAAGSWTPALLPWLGDVMWPTAQAVMHFRAPNLERFQPPGFPVWTADVGKTGWYGFPAKDDGTFKLANHGPGWRLDPAGERRVPDGVEDKFRGFLAESLPELASAPKLYERMCFYCDTFDGDFWIARDPERPGLLVSTGGSGHALKFAPLLGRITADVFEGRDNPYAARFAWRTRGAASNEQARFAEPPRK